MATHAPPSDEIDRVAALSRYRILDTPPDIAFDDLAHLAAALCRAPIAVITFIDQDRQWFKAKIGLTMTQTVRSSGLCAQAVQHKTLIAIEDARADPRFSSHPLVREDPRVRFYCGAPILNPDGHAVGTIAVMDAAPRVPTEEQCQALRRLARQAAAQLELRRLTFDRSSLDAQSLEEIMAGMADAVFVTDRSGRVLGANHEAEVLFGRTSSDLTGRLLHDCVHRHERGAAQGSGELCGLVSAAALRGRTESPNDVFVRNNGSTVQVSWIAAPLIRRGEWVGGLVSVRDLTAQKRNEEALGVLAGTTRATGVAFLRELVETLARSIGAEYAFCIRPLPGQVRAKAVAGHGPDGPLEQVEYDLAGTPCEHVLREGFCHYPDAVQAAFSQDEMLRQLSIESYMALTLPSPTGEAIGWIAVLARTPLKDPEWAESLLRMAAGRAGSELGRSLAEQQLQESEERYALALRGTSDGIWDWNVVTGEAVHSAGWKALLGFAGDELPDLASSFFDRVHPDDLAHVRAETRNHFERREPFDVQCRVRHKDGSYRWIQSRAQALWDEEGRPYRMVGATTDITGRKQTEEALQLAKYTVDHATEAIYWVGSDAELLDVNDAATVMLGYSREEFLGMTVHDLNPSFPAETWPAYWQETRQKGSVSFETSHRTKDGRLIPIEVNANFMYYNGRECHCAFVRDVTERKRAEGALRASEERFHLAIEATNEGLWDWNVRTDAVYFSPQWIRLLGYRPEEVTGGTVFFFEILHPEDAPRMREVLHAHLDGRTPTKELEVRLRHQSGEYRWYLDRGKVVARDPSGQPLRMVGTITDITERKQAERERAEALSTLQTIMETVPDVIFVLDLEGRLSKWNLRLETVTGYTHDELLGKSALEMVPRTEADATSAAIRQAFEAGYAELEGHLLTKDGRAILYHWNGTPFTDLHGRVVGITGVGRDVTDRKQTEALLRSSEERFRLVAQATNDILWDWDLLTGDHWWSPNACDKFGYDPRTEPSVDAWSNRLHPEDKERVLDLVSQAIQTDVRTFFAEYRFQLADGTYGYFLDRAYIVRNEAGGAMRMIGAMIDVTAPRRAYASLEEAYRRFQAMSQELHTVESNERRRLSRELHDEFGQLLTSLKFDLASVKRVAARSSVAGGRSPERLARALETTDLLFARLRQIVRVLRPPVLEQLGLKAGLEALIADVQARTGLCCSLVFEQAHRRGERLPTLETAFYRIVQELLTNVIRHAHAATVSILVQRNRREWRLTVTDDGVGFDVGALSPLGGFGLRGIRERAEILAGQVEISSGVDTGTMVQVRIPVGSTPGRSTEGSVPPGPASRRRKPVHE